MCCPCRPLLKQLGAVCCCPCAEEHRALVRTNLRALLNEGINPLSFFDRDYKKVSV